MLGAVFCGHQHAVAQAHTGFAQLSFERIHLLGQLGQRHHPVGHEEEGVVGGLRSALVEQLVDSGVWGCVEHVLFERHALGDFGPQRVLAAHALGQV